MSHRLLLGHFKSRNRATRRRPLKGSRRISSSRLYFLASSVHSHGRSGNAEESEPVRARGGVPKSCRCLSEALWGCECWKRHNFGVQSSYEALAFTYKPKSCDSEERTTARGSGGPWQHQRHVSCCMIQAHSFPSHLANAYRLHSTSS